MLKATAHSILVTPTGDDGESQRGQLIVVNKPAEDSRVWRGVVEDIGPHVLEADVGLEVGCIAHYTGYFPIGEKHVVPSGNFIAWEPNE